MSQNRVQVRSKSELAIALSKLKGFEARKVRQEQYEMDSEIGASCLWSAYLLGDIEGKVIFDLGCGTGILGIGALLLGAKKVVFVDLDEKALKIAKDNVKMTSLLVESETSKEKKGESWEFRHLDLKDMGEGHADTVIQNPPFGTKARGADRLFIEKALEIAPIAYSFHKSETKAFLEGFLAEKGAKITHIWDYKYPIRASYSFHRRQIHRINVSCFRFQRR